MASVREHVSKSGERTYQVLYRHGGKQPSITFTDRKEAEKLKELINLVGAEEAFKLQAQEHEQGVTVDQLAEMYFEWKARDVTERTMADYRRDYKNWIQPRLGHRVAEMVDEADVQQVVDHMAKHLAPKTVGDKHMVLHSMYQFGKAKSRRRLTGVTHNPCTETEMPKRTKKPPKGSTVHEFRALLLAAQKRNRDACDLILFLGETGWRFSEATALAVRDVEDDGRDVYVTVSRVTRIDGKGRQFIEEDEAKSWAAFRRIRLFPESAAMVRRRLVGKGIDELLLTNSLGRHWNQHTWLDETWPKIVKDAGLSDPNRKITPHWLRHMHVAVLAKAGVPMQEIQRRIGHESIQTTINVYGGMIGDLSDDTLARATEIMAGRLVVPGVAPAIQGSVVAVQELAGGQALT